MTKGVPTTYSATFYGKDLEMALEASGKFNETIGKEEITPYSSFTERRSIPDEIVYVTVVYMMTEKTHKGLPDHLKSKLRRGVFQDQ